MKKLKERIPLKYLYVLSACIAVLLSVGLYYTYAMFTANVTSGNVVNMDTTLKYNFDISGTQTFHVGKGSIASFYATVSNSSSGSIYYEIYYSSCNDLSNVVIGEVVEDKTTTTSAQNTSGNLSTNTSKDVPLVIANNSDNDIEVVIGVASGYVGNAITYGSNGYPNGTKITSTYNSNDITNSCEGGGIDASNCTCSDEVIVSYGKKNTYTTCTCKELANSQVVNGDTSGANAPVLVDGMIPITYDGSKWIKVATTNLDAEWYNYSNQIWANAVLVTSGTRSTYMSASVGTEVKETDILAYLVWIPRYKYKLFNATYASSTSASLIDVVFESGTSTTGTTKCSVSEIGVETCTNKSNGKYYTHPAFTFGDTELKGIWVGKFETTGRTYSPSVKPGISSLRNENVSTLFTASQRFASTTYLTSTGVNQADSHMMKNIEWGAVAYLKQSNYGLGKTDITINNGGLITGGGSGTSYKTNIGQSTTGNITGVYDMSGGASEYVMGVMQDNTSSRSPMSGLGANSTTRTNSGYLGKTGSSYTDSGNTLAFPDSKYYDLYANGTTSNNYTRSHLGDATGETKGWYSDWSNFVYPTCPWFERGGYYESNGTLAGVFGFETHYGSGENYIGFRISLAVTK